MAHTRPTLPRFDEPNDTVDFKSGPTLVAWRAAWSQMQSAVQPDGLGALLPNGRLATARSIQTALLLRRASVELPLLIASTRDLAIARCLAVAVPLIGAGPGLTPSWDDLLIGYICGLRATASGDLGRTSFLYRFGAAIQKASAATTDVSRWYIQQTIAGHGPQWIEDVLDAIGSGDLERTSRSAQSALHIGNTSGTDMMLGAVLGSSVWQLGAQAAEVLTTLSCRDPHFANATSAETHAAH